VLYPLVHPSRSARTPPAHTSRSVRAPRAVQGALEGVT